MSFKASEFDAIFLWAIAAYARGPEANPDFEKKLVLFIKTSWIMFRLEMLLFLFGATGCESVVISSRDRLGGKFIPALCILNDYFLPGRVTKLGIFKYS